MAKNIKMPAPKPKQTWVKKVAPVKTPPPAQNQRGRIKTLDNSLIR